MKSRMQAQDEQLAALTRQMGKWVEHVMGGHYKQFAPHDVWQPAINLYEDNEGFHMVADLAGVEPETVELSVQGRQLTLAGERASPCPENHGVLRTHLMEIDHGTFHRVLEIPHTVDVERIAARYRNGLLWIELPKKQ